MLTIVVSDSKSFRASRISEIMQDNASSEVMVFDDTLITIADLEQYLYPSLFNITVPLIHTRFIIDAKEKDISANFWKKLIASPTVFVFEEMALSKPFLTAVKKQGATIHNQEKIKSAAKENLFAVTNLLAMPNKKDRWIAYQKAVAQYPIEAILGLLYWKVRDMAMKEKSEQGTYRVLYAKMLEAHSNAWQEGTPLELAIEKTLLLY